jgi:hypothetical protein
VGEFESEGERVEVGELAADSDISLSGVETEDTEGEEEDDVKGEGVAV